jgi:mannose-6-phosphate isomerase
MTPLYPLRFRPLWKQYLWGGRRLASLLAKPLPEGGAVAESWEVCDRGPEQSVVAVGALAGRTLGELVATRGRELFGRHPVPPRFPLLVKFLDAAQPLSVQVHPDDAQAARRTPPDLGKTEAWVVLAAEPGSVIYAGLKPGVDREALNRAVREGTVDRCLHRFEPHAGDCVFLPAGTVHALGAGIVVAEIQQSSDITFRLFDWNRLGPDGKPRPLHVAESLEAIDFARGPVDVQPGKSTNRPFTSRLVECPYFILDRCATAAGEPLKLGGDERFHILIVLSGQVALAEDPTGRSLSLGEIALLPAALGPQDAATSPNTVVLDVFLP